MKKLFCISLCAISMVGCTNYAGILKDGTYYQPGLDESLQAEHAKLDIARIDGKSGIALHFIALDAELVQSTQTFSTKLRTIYLNPGRRQVEFFYDGLSKAQGCFSAMFQSGHEYVFKYKKDHKGLHYRLEDMTDERVVSMGGCKHMRGFKL